MVNAKARSVRLVGLVAVFLATLWSMPVEAQDRLTLWSVKTRFLTAGPGTGTRHVVSPVVDDLTTDTREVALAVHPGAAPLIALRDRARRIGENGVVWKGRIGKTGSATFTRVNKALVGSLLTPDGRRYRLRFTAKDGYVLEEIDWRRFEVNHGTLARAVRAPAGTTCDSDRGDVIDVLVVWTDATITDAEDGPGGPDFATGLIEAARDEMNDALRASGVHNVTVRVVHIDRVEYNVTTHSGAVWDELAAGTGGLGKVHSMRDHHGADVVVMVASIPGDPFFSGTTGFTFQDFHVENRSTLAGVAFVLISPWSLTVEAGYFFAHELGHVMGAQHDGGFGDPFGHSRDHISPPTDPSIPGCSQGWRTLMANCNNCGACATGLCPKIGAWSNSNAQLTHCNAPMGLVDVRDNALTIQKTARTVANIRCSKH